MQAEAGETLGEILTRKEWERQLGGGRFYWGIGNSLGEKVNVLTHREPTPQVVFSVMLGRPRSLDASPSSVLAWLSYLEPTGELRPLPDFALILSRGNTPTGPKRRHYALVCHSTEALNLNTGTSVDSGHLRNAASAGTTVGASQVTAIVEHRGSAGAVRSGPIYTSGMMAQLAAPYFVRLAEPVKLLSSECFALNNVVAGARSATEWSELVQTIAKDARRRRNRETLGLFETN
jgi:hypothetical protein